MGLFRMTQNFNSGLCKIWQNHRQIPQSSGMEKEEVGKSCFEGKSSEEKQEFGVIFTTPWLICRGSGFLKGDTMYIFSSWC